MTYSALPASAIQSFMQNANWTGTVVVPLTTGAAHFLNYYGNSGSTVAISSMTAGWFGNAAVESKVEILGAVTNTAFSSSFANTWASAIGSGSLAFTSDATTSSQVFWIKDVSEYAGDLATTNTVPLQLGGSSKLTAQYGDGAIEICTNMTATIAAGKTWTAANGITVNGSLGGSGTVSGALTFNSGSTLVASSTPLTATGSVSGTASIDLSGVTPATGLQILKTSSKPAGTYTISDSTYAANYNVTAKEDGLYLTKRPLMIIIK